MNNYRQLNSSWTRSCIAYLFYALFGIIGIWSQVLAQFDAPPDPDEAFKVQILAIEPGHIQIGWDALEHIYMYDDKFTISADNPDISFGPIQAPEGEIIDDPLFGEVRIHWDSIILDVDYTSEKPITTKLTLGGQGCHKVIGICYSPVSHDFKVDLPASAGATDVNNVAADLSSNQSNQVSEQSNSGKSISIWKSMAIAFLSGLALSFTPCVLPMVPILAGIVMGGPASTTPLATRLTKGNIYILGTVISYAIIGAFAGYTGTQLQAWLQSTWTTLFLIAILVIMALSMFGVFKISMPESITNRLNNVGQSKGGYWGILLLGMTSALMVGACVTPILIGVISGIVATGSPVYGALTMSALALGMGVPLLAVCFGAAKWLPKSGPWMTVVSHLLGWGLLIVAAWLAANLLPINPLWPVVALLLCATVYSIWLIKSLNNPNVAILVALFGILTGVYAVGAYQGNMNITKPITTRLQQQEGYKAELIENQTQLNTILANNSDKKVIIDFRADWCTDCVRFERTTLRDPSVIEVIESGQIAFYQIDITKPNGPEAEIQKRYGVYGPPAMMIFAGSDIPHIEYGFADVNTFLSLVN